MESILKKQFNYNISKIAESQKLLIEILESRTTLTNEQSSKFGIKFNSTQYLMRETAVMYYNTIGNYKKAAKIKNCSTYISEVVKLVEAALLQVKKETNNVFKNKYIKFINTDDYTE